MKLLIFIITFGLVGAFVEGNISDISWWVKILSIVLAINAYKAWG